jgi:hypothetical protein
MLFCFILYVNIFLIFFGFDGSQGTSRRARGVKKTGSKRTDFVDARELSPLAAKARQALETVEGIETTPGSEAYRAAYEFYADARAAAERDVPEARAVYETLKAAKPRKGGGRRGKPQDETETASR